ncbi:LuxR C-terminal-related transcriptional regulator [Solirubrobacter phytolaccae]|uniref:LuxR C-terminal-related transcriptional regulator n=1 Tax=Solirubrobacter phytolaccae TaxID=1404360 RepID=A0A9X3SC32_9ACTN|nr:response regulator transcription factor [Solirubrobacter phytolaccae]MDA0184221.1 LuxR C-terminal-related transcriptional regulator [Solirubrobacter phytolaccae]
MRELASAAFITVHGEPGIGKTRLLRELADVARAHGVPVDEGLDLPRPPVVVIADDLDEADADELETFARLLRTPPRGGVLIALAYRRLPAALSTALDGATRRGLVTDLPLAPLAAEDTAAYGPALQRLSGGNPFYLLELAQHAGGVPPAIGASVAGELARLSEPAKALVRGAAVGRESLELAVAASGEPEDLAALDEAVDAGLLVATGVPRHYRFRHPIVRMAVYDATSPGWRLAAHARVADALRDGPAKARAHHLERCAKAGDEEAVAVLAEAAAGAPPETAARWYAAAQRLKRDRRRSLLVPLAHALATTGQLEKSLQALREALALVPGDARLIAAVATCEHLLGRYATAHARLSTLPEHDVALLVDAVYEPDYVALKSRAKRAVVAEPESGTAWALLALAHGTLGELTTAEEALQEAAAIVDATPDEQLSDSAYYLGFAEYMCERDLDAIRHFRRPAQGPFRLPMLVGLAHALERQGRLPEALEVAERAVDLARHDQLLSWARAEEAYIAAVMGERERAVEAADEAVALASRLDASFLTIATHALTAATFLEAGRPERSLEQVRLAGEKLDPGRRALLLVVQGFAEGALGRPAAAVECVERARALVDGLPLRVPQAMVRNARARLALLAGDRESAAALAATDSPFPLSAAEGHLIRGLALGTTEDLVAAQAVPGARRLHDEAARELRRLGHTAPGRQRRFARGELSGREREIAELVAQGRSNREIGAALYLAEKTVEGHLTNIFGKLGVRSRAEVAAYMGRAYA